MPVHIVKAPFIERTDCRLCGKSKLLNVFSLPPTPPANAFQSADTTLVESIPLDVMRCSNCGHAQLSQVVSPKYLFSNYAYASGTSAVFREHFKAYAADVWARWSCKPSDLVVEIGSNDGTLLEEFQKLGARVIGVEPAQNLADIAMKKNVRTVNTFFDHSVAGNLYEGHGPAKLIVANNVFAHINDLSAVFRAAQRLLAPDGVLIFEVQYVGDLLSHGLFDMVYHEHLDYHALSPLHAAMPSMTNNELFVLRVDRVNTHGGSIRVAVGRAALNTPGSHTTVSQFLRFEEDEGMNRPGAWTLLAKKVTKAKDRLISQLTAAYTENPDANVVGFGAPAKATTLLHTFGLTGGDLDCIVDDSPLKQGLFMPGLGIPIVSPEMMLAEPPDYVVVLAWNFAESIIAKWQPILPKTKFIVPFA